MTDDERAIRDLVATWMKASESGDVQTVMSLMADDVIFMVPGREPKDAFRAALETMKNVRMTGTSDIREINVLGDWACIRNYVEIAITPPSGDPMRRSGYTLSILRKQPNGKWALWRDANLITIVLVTPRGRQSPAAALNTLAGKQERQSRERSRLR